MRRIELIKCALTGAILLIHTGLMAQSSESIRQVPLNPLAITQIPVSLNGPTTIRFPSPISDLEGAFISTDANSSAFFLLSFRPGGAFFSVRALVPHTNTSLNVVWKNQTYVLELQESKTPWLSVIFTESPAVAPPAREPVTPSRLLGLLDTAKAFPVLRTQHPEAVAGIECVRPNTMNDYGDYSIKTEEVFRFDDADSLVFRIAVSNKTAQLMRYQPQSLMVQAGNRIFYQSITDGNGDIPAQATVPIYFAITGTASGGRNDISPRNDFLVLLHRVGPSQPETSLPLPPSTNQPSNVSSGPPIAPAPPALARQAQIAAPSTQRNTVQASTGLSSAQPAIPSAVSVLQTGWTPPTAQVVQPALQPQTSYYYPAPATYSYPATPVYYYTVPQPVYYYAAPQYYYTLPPVYYSTVPWGSTFSSRSRHFGWGYGR